MDSSIVIGYRFPNYFVFFMQYIVLFERLVVYIVN